MFSILVNETFLYFCVFSTHLRVLTHCYVPTMASFALVLLLDRLKSYSHLKTFDFFRSYGDKTPASVPARVFGFLWIIVGVVIMSIFTATLSTAFSVEHLDPNNIVGLTVSYLVD